MQDLFTMAAGSIIGKQHHFSHKNNQDAYYTSISDSALIAVVCDGCGSCRHSEVGAAWGARLLVETLTQHLQQNQLIASDFWLLLKQDLLQQLTTIAHTLMGTSSLAEVINDYFLFTIVGTVITPSLTVIFAIGDGIIALNNELKVLESGINNAPDYLAYGCLNNDHRSDFQVYYQLPTVEVNSILIATDGLKDFKEQAEAKLPGKQEKLGEINQFWQSASYFKNPDLIRRRLFLANREVIKPNWQQQVLTKESGLLSDDTTLVVIKRKTDGHLS